MINWSNDGIAYGQGLAANPQGDWWGVVNRESSEGVLRVGDNDITPGMKYWEWGFNGSFNTNPYSKGNSGRPYVELWAGTSKQFFVPDTLGAGASKTWTESFLPTMDMPQTTNADVDGAASLEFADRKVTARVFSTHIGRTQTARIVDAVTGRVLASRTFVADPLRSIQLRGDAPAGTTARVVLTDADGTELLRAEDSEGLGTIDPAVPSGSATITGKATAGQTLTGVDGVTWGGSNPTISHEWLRDGAVVGTGTSYALNLDDVGHQITFRVTATNDAGPVSVTSAAVVPGVAADYTAITTATVLSTAGNAALTVSEPGHLSNGAFSLPEPLQVAFSKSAWTGPVSNEDATVTFAQHIGAGDALRTGPYSKTRTFTLSTTTP